MRIYRKKKSCSNSKLAHNTYIPTFNQEINSQITKNESYVLIIVS